MYKYFKSVVTKNLMATLALCFLGFSIYSVLVTFE